MELHPSMSDTNVVAQYAFHNGGTYPVAIDSVKTSCGCTTATLDKKNYAPGEKGEISVNFDIGQRVGEQQKEIMVFTNDPREMMVLLRMKILIPEVLRIAPPFVSWEKGEAAQAKSIRVEVMSTNVHVVAALSGADAFKSELREITAGHEYQVLVTPVTTTNQMVGTIRLQTDFPSDRPRSFNAYAAVREKASLLSAP